MNTRDLLALLATTFPDAGLPTTDRRVGGERRITDSMTSHQRRRSQRRATLAANLDIVPDLFSITSQPPAQPGLAVGQTYQLTWVVQNKHSGQSFDSAVVWSSSNESVATVDTAGLATAVGSGSAVITGTTVGNMTATVTVTVQASQVPDALSIITPTVSIVTTGTKLIQGYVLQSGIPLTGQTGVSWDTTDHGVGTMGVDSSPSDPLHQATFTPVSAGSCTIQMIKSGLTTATVGATVTSTPPAGDFPNLPSGWLEISNVTFDDVAKEPPSAPYFDANRWQKGAGGSRISIQSLSTIGNFPAGPYGDLAWIAKSCKIGEVSGTPFRMEMQAADSTTVGYRKMYYKWWIAFQSNYDSQRTDGQWGQKWGYFRGISGHLTNHFMGYCEFPSTGKPASEKGVRIQQQWGNTAIAPKQQTWDSSHTSSGVNFGQWHEIEALLDAGTAGNADGSVQVWRDGVLLINKQNVVMTPSNQTAKPGFRGLSWQPIYGGTRVNQSYDSYSAVARFACYMSD